MTSAVDELYKAHAVSDIALRHAERLDALEAENARLKAELAWMQGRDMNAAEQPCMGCGKPLLVENAWMDDGCPCNTPAGVNNLNLYRWRLLHELQQKQQRR